MDTNEMLLPWLRAYAEAFYDFVNQSLLVNDLPEPDTLQIRTIEQVPHIKMLCGSSLALNINNIKTNLLFLASPKVLNQITGLLLFDNSKSNVEHIERYDTACEVVNIIAGGIKSRLSMHTEHEILLGLPEYLDSTAGIIATANTRILGCYNFNNNLEVYFLITR